MIKAVLFDVGGTLIEVNPSVGAVYAEVAERHGVKADPEELNRRFKRVWKENRPLESAIDRTWWREIVEKVFEGLTFNQPDNFFEDVYERFRDPRVWKILPGVEETLTQLKSRGLILAVASNWDSRLPELLDRLNLSSYFDYQFISFALGINKSNPEFYQRCLNDLGLQAKQVIHIGDDEENDFISPQKVGVRSLLMGKDLAQISDVIPVINTSK